MEAELAGHIQLIKLAIAYTLLGAFVFTVVVVCLSLVRRGVIVTASQQKKLFAVLIVEIVIICTGSFSNMLELNPRSAQRKIENPLRNEIHTANEALRRSRAKLNEEVLAGLAPTAAGLALLLLKKAHEQDIEVTLIAGYRSPEQQEELFAKGLTKAQRSTHNTGLAFDVAIVEGDKLVFSGEKYKLLGIIGKKLGLVWGGDRKEFTDLPHFETEDAREALKKLGDS